MFVGPGSAKFVPLPDGDSYCCGSPFGATAENPSKGRNPVNQRTLFIIVAVLVGLAALIFIIQNL